MPKAVEELNVTDAAAFRATITPHLVAVLDANNYKSADYIDEALADAQAALNGKVTDAQGYADAAAASAAGLAAVDPRLDALEYAIGGGLQITAFTATPASIEMGGNSNVALAWTIAGTVTGQSMADSVSGAVALANPVTDRGKNVAFNTSRTFTLTAENTGAPGGTDTKTRQVTVPALPRRFWGVADAAALDGPGVVALAGSELAGSRAKTFTVDGGSGAGKYLYFAFLADLGAAASYKIFGAGETPIATTVSVTTAAGLTANYIVLRSPEKVLGSATVEVQ